MGRRSDIDWEQVERLYIAGQLTIKQIAAECGVSESQIKVKASKFGWQRDLSAAIEARTKAKIAAIDVSAIVEESAEQSARKSARTIQEAIEQASDVAAGVELRHRSSLRLDAERVERVEAIYDEMMSQAESVRDINTLTDALKKLVDARAKIREQERTIYKLDKASGDAEKSSLTDAQRASRLASLLSKVRDRE